MPQQINITLDGAGSGTHLLGRAVHDASGDVHVSLLPNGTNTSRSVVYISGVATSGVGVVVQFTANNFLNAATAIRARLVDTGERLPVDDPNRVDPLTIVGGGRDFAGRVVLIHDDNAKPYAYTPGLARRIAAELVRCAGIAESEAAG